MGWKERERGGEDGIRGGRTAGAGKVRGHLNGDVEVLFLILREAVCAGDVVCYAQILGDYAGVTFVMVSSKL